MVHYRLEGMTPGKQAALRGAERHTTARRARHEWMRARALNEIREGHVQEDDANEKCAGAGGRVQ